VRLRQSGLRLERVSNLVGRDFLMLDLLVADEALEAVWN
jgi:hypothetical protein